MGIGPPPRGPSGAAAYRVSGEHAMLCSAVGRGWLDGDRAILGALMAFKRAGADGVLTCFAVDVARRLNG